MFGKHKKIEPTEINFSFDRKFPSQAGNQFQLLFYLQIPIFRKTERELREREMRSRTERERERERDRERERERKKREGTIGSPSDFESV